MSILDSILTKEQKAAGLYLEVDIFLYRVLLIKEGRIVKDYNYHTVTFDQIRHDADQILEWDSSGISFERV